VVQTLQSFFDIEVGNKSIKVLPGSGRLAADVVACLQFRKYTSLHNFVQGVAMLAPDGSLVVHFPRLHQEKGEQKNTETEGRFKPTVRVFKNIRSYLVDQRNIRAELAPSYFLECLLYNVPSTEFEGSYGEAFCHIVNWLQRQTLDGFVCMSEQDRLFGSSPEQWSIGDAQQFINAATALWNNWR
jgi:hypothetical protein